MSTLSSYRSKENHITKHYQLPEKPCSHIRKKRKHQRSLCPKKFWMKSILEDQEGNDQLVADTKIGMIALDRK